VGTIRRYTHWWNRVPALTSIASQRRGPNAEARDATIAALFSFACASVPTKPPARVTCGSKVGHRPPLAPAYLAMNPALVDARAGGGSSHRLYTLVAMTTRRVK
jgi:hypothetical protein